MYWQDSDIRWGHLDTVERGACLYRGDWLTYTSIISPILQGL